MTVLDHFKALLGLFVSRIQRGSLPDEMLGAGKGLLFGDSGLAFSAGQPVSGAAAAAAVRCANASLSDEPATHDASHVTSSRPYKGDTSRRNGALHIKGALVAELQSGVLF